MTPRKLAAATLAAAALLALPAAAAERAGRWVASFETVRLPADDSMGLASASWLVEAAPGWWLGPSLYGAASGRRGGLFTWGLEAQRAWSIGRAWRATAGFYAGGGGGASAPVGSGLMLRPHVDLAYDFGGFALGLGWSRVQFADGDIASSQWGVVFTVDDVFSPAERGHFRPQAVSLTVGRYRRAPDGVGFLALRAEQPIDARWAGTAEAGAAASGGADGYAEFALGVLGLWPAAEAPLALGLHAAAGLGGGGAVPTGGGTIGKLGVLARASWSGWRLELEAGRVRAFDGDLRSPYAALTLGRACCSTPSETEWATSLQRYRGAQRRDGRIEPLTTLGLKASQSLGGPLFVTGQAYGGIDGGAGAYSVGLLGVGAAWPLDASARWRLGAEALAGAAGGGGVSSAGGAVVQPMLWADAAIGEASRLRLGAGAIRSVRGELSTPIVELSWAVALGAR